MKPVKAVYTIPHLKLTFIVACPLSGRSSTSQDNRKTTEYFERILLLKDRMTPKADRQWRIKRVSQNDFLASIEQCKSISREYTNQTSDIPISMELLAMNLGKNADFDPTYFTPKILDNINASDMIEVFI